MSREFGSYSSGYFHDQIGFAVDDLAGGHDALTREWAAFFRAFLPVAVAICSSEAGDSGPDDPILTTISQMPALEDALAKVKSHVEIYKCVADTAVRNEVRKATKNA